MPYGFSEATKSLDRLERHTDRAHHQQVVHPHNDVSSLTDFMAELEVLISDIAYAGLRCDMNSTMCLPDTPAGNEAVGFLLNYFGTNVERLQARCFEILELENDRFGRRFLFGFLEGVSDARFRKMVGNSASVERNFKTHEEQTGYERGLIVGARTRVEEIKR